MYLTRLSELLCGILGPTSYWSFVYWKTYVDQSPKPQVGSNWPKNPPLPFLPFGEILGSHHATWCITLPKHISLIIEHLIKDLAEKPLPPPSCWTGKFIFRLDLSISCNFQQQLWFSWQKSPPPFCLFMRALAHVTHVEYPWFLCYWITLRFLLCKYLL